MKKENIYLDFLKLNENQKTKVIKLLPKPSSNEYEYCEYHHCLHLDKNLGWFIDKKEEVVNKTEISYKEFKELFNPKVNIINSTNDILSDLKVGQEIEYDGFILKVDREVNKWYITKSLIDNSIAFRNLTKEGFNQWNKCEDIIVKEITNQCFINQLEENSK